MVGFLSNADEFAYWSSIAGSNTLNWVTHEGSSLAARGTFGAPIAGFTCGVDSDSDNPLLRDILNTGTQGVNITWTTPKGWQAPQAPDAMRNTQAYSGIAVNANWHVYALERGAVKESVVSTDGLTWSLVGDVPPRIKLSGTGCSTFDDTICVFL